LPYKLILILLSLLFVSKVLAQDHIAMQVTLDTQNKSLKIIQKTTYFNTSKDTLSSIYFHDWANAFSNKNTHLGKRFIEDYKKSFFFTKKKNRGYTNIKNIVVNNKTSQWKRPDKVADILEVLLLKPLLPNDSISINMTYVVKLPHAKFTDYGVAKQVYNLRYWHLVPVVYNTKWQFMHHLNLDDLHQNATNYKVILNVPETYAVASNLEITKIKSGGFLLQGKELCDFELNISAHSKFEDFKTDAVLVSTNLDNIEIGNTVKRDVLNRQLKFLKEKLGDYPHKKLFINETTYAKNPLYGFSQLPGFLRPFSDVFEWDLRMFKTLTKYYIDNTLASHTRKNTWLQETLQTYMMMQYVDLYYPDTKLIGGISAIWGVRTYHMSELLFNDRYNIGFQYAARLNHDQPIALSIDSLTNFNRLVGRRYKAALGLRYLDRYLGDSIVYKGLKYSFSSKSGDISNIFKDYIKSASTKEVSWFFEEFIKTDKKLDFKLKRIIQKGDSVLLTIRNKRKSHAPICLMGLKNDTVVTRCWVNNIGYQKQIKVANNKAKVWGLNVEGIAPEINMKNNFVKTKRSFFKKPLQIRWLADAENPSTHQLFFEPSFNYNYYDGFALAMTFSNKGLLKKDFKFELTPSYSFKSKSLTGLANIRYWKHLDNDLINSYKVGVSAAYFHYKQNLSYKKITPYASLFFKKKNLRSVKNSGLSASYTLVDREIDTTQGATEEYNKYNIFSLSYWFNNPELINSFSYRANIELASQFSKLSTTLRFRKLTNSKRQFDVRFFAGAFLYNQTTTDFFSYGVNRPNDYRFRYKYFGRSEDSGFLSQQIIITDAGFKSKMPISFANQWITALSTSVGIWRWFEIYNDVGFAKNSGQKVAFIHDKGIRLNFVNDILEVYFPLHSTNGWEITQPHYEEHIRFVFSANFSSIYNFMRRGFM